MSTHAKFSPSSASTWIKCALYPSMREKFPDSSSAAADEGTRLHAVAEVCLLHGAPPADPNDRRIILPYLEAVQKACDRAENLTLLIEKKVQIFGKECEGTPDVAVVSPELVCIIDLKTGTSPVKAFENLQLILYALGIIEEYKIPNAADVELIIVQPRKKTGWPVDVWRTDVETIRGWFMKFLKAIERGKLPNPPAIAGSHCYWCPGKLHCDEYKSYHGMKRSLI